MITGRWSINGEKDGWISPQGKFFECGFGGHTAWMRTEQKNEEDCVARGWKRFTSSVYSSGIILGGQKPFTNGQAALLLNWAKKFNKRIKVMDWQGSLSFEWFV